MSIDNDDTTGRAQAARERVLQAVEAARQQDRRNPISGLCEAAGLFNDSAELVALSACASQRVLQISIGLHSAIQSGTPIAEVDASNEYADLLADLLDCRGVLPSGYSEPVAPVTLDDALSELAGPGAEESDLDAEELPEGGAPCRVSTLRTINRREEQHLEELRDIVAGAAGVDVGGAA